MIGFDPWTHGHLGPGVRNGTGLWVPTLRTKLWLTTSGQTLHLWSTSSYQLFSSNMKSVRGKFSRKIPGFPYFGGAVAIINGYNLPCYQSAQIGFSELFFTMVLHPHFSWDCTPKVVKCHQHSPTNQLSPWPKYLTITEVYVLIIRHHPTTGDIISNRYSKVFKIPTQDIYQLLHKAPGKNSIKLSPRKKYCS